MHTTGRREWTGTVTVNTSTFPKGLGLYHIYVQAGTFSSSTKDYTYSVASNSNCNAGIMHLVTQKTCSTTASVVSNLNFYIPWTGNTMIGLNSNIQMGVPTALTVVCKSATAVPLYICDWDDQCSSIVQVSTGNSFQCTYNSNTQRYESVISLTFPLGTVASKEGYYYFKIQAGSTINYSTDYTYLTASDSNCKAGIFNLLPNNYSWKFNAAASTCSTNPFYLGCNSYQYAMTPKYDCVDKSNAVVPDSKCTGSAPTAPVQCSTKVGCSSGFTCDISSSSDGQCRSNTCSPPAPSVAALDYYVLAFGTSPNGSGYQVVMGDSITVTIVCRGSSDTIWMYMCSGTGSSSCSDRLYVTSTSNYPTCTPNSSTGRREWTGTVTVNTSTFPKGLGLYHIYVQAGTFSSSTNDYTYSVASNSNCNAGVMTLVDGGYAWKFNAAASTCSTNPSYLGCNSYQYAMTPKYDCVDKSNAVVPDSKCTGSAPTAPVQCSTKIGCSSGYSCNTNDMSVISGVVTNGKCEYTGVSYSWKFSESASTCAENPNDKGCAAYKYAMNPVYKCTGSDGSFAPDNSCSGSAPTYPVQCSAKNGCLVGQICDNVQAIGTNGQCQTASGTYTWKYDKAASECSQSEFHSGCNSYLYAMNPVYNCVDETSATVNDAFCQTSKPTNPVQCETKVGGCSSAEYCDTGYLNINSINGVTYTQSGRCKAGTDPSTDNAAFGASVQMVVMPIVLVAMFAGF